MDNQLVQPKVIALRITILTMVIFLSSLVVIMGLCLNRVSEPYVLEVLSLQGDKAIGEAIFQINCSACHGLQAYGSVGPSLHHVSQRKSKISLIYQVTSGKTPPMPKFQPSPQEMADLLSYLEKL